MMTSDRKAKMAARDRMADTGEPYSRARRAAGKSWPRLRDSSVNWHFVALGGHHGFGPWGQHATVRDASTGAVTAIVPTPEALRRFDRVTSASAPGAGQQLHVLAGHRKPQAGPGAGHPVPEEQATQLYALRVDAAGQVAGLAPVPVASPLPAGPGTPWMAVRADGTGLLCAQTQHRGRSWETVVYTVNLATGEPRVLAEAVLGPVTELSWAADARAVAFEWNPAMGRAGARQAGIYMTDPAGPAGWEAGSRLVTPSDDGLGPLISPVISRDGTAVYVTAAQASLAGGSHWNRLLEVPAGGGQPRVLFELRYQANPANLAYMWDDVRLDPSGRFLLLLGFGWAYLVEISTAACARIPFPV
jgi:hypothetical protein